MPISAQSKFSLEIQRAIVESLRGGNYLEPSAEAAGVSRQTVLEWIRRGEGRDDRSCEPEFEAFALAVRQARAEAERNAVRALTAAMPEDWRAAEAWLKRARPDRWTDRQQVQHDVGETLAELLAPTPLEATHTRLPETGWEGTDG
jgi:hypothetical protein